MKRRSVEAGLLVVMETPAVFWAFPNGLRNLNPGDAVLVLDLVYGSYVRVLTRFGVGEVGYSVVYR